MKKRELPSTVYVPDIENWAPKSRVALFAALRSLQSIRCPVCGDFLLPHQIQDVHECIVTKGDVQGWPKAWKFLINNIYNGVVVHRPCHMHGNRQSWWDYKCSMFGRDEMEKWYYNLPFKTNIWRFE